MVWSFPANVGAEESSAGDGPRISWNGATTIDWADKAHFVLENRLQTRFSLEDIEEELTGSFQVRRSQIKLVGWAWTPDLHLAFQYDWRNGALQDAYMEWQALEKGRLALRVGQFKVPFGRQELVSSRKQEFLERSIVSREFAKSRDIGLELLGKLAGGKLEYSLGLFNGEGPNVNRNANGKLQWNGRVVWMPLGPVALDESARAAKKTGLALAAQFEINDRRPDRPQREIFGGDLVFQLKRFSLFSAAFFRTETDESLQEYDSRGFHAQAGCLLLPKNLELALRYATWDPNREILEDQHQELATSLTWFFHGHDLKLQTELRHLEDQHGEEAATKTDTWSTQLQLRF